jgi:hypothetical protein
MRHRRTAISLLPALVAVAWASPGQVGGQETFDRARDRGPGVSSSMFGIYVEKGEFLFYPYFEYYRDSDAEYSPDELGYGLDQDFRGEYRASEGLIFLGYGISENLMAEFEVAIISARQDKSPDDPTDTPSRIEESGLGDVEGQLRWRWNRETESRPEFFSYFETVLPLQKKKKLIGTQDWEFQLGTGVIRGFSWGTMTLRFAAEYDRSESSFAFGEYALEYLRRISSGLRVFAAVEGSEDEVELITEAQVFLRPNILLKLNNAFGITSKAAGWAPEIGVMFSFK